MNVPFRKWHPKHCKYPYGQEYGMHGYAYRYCIFKCNTYPFMHPKMSKVLIHSYQTNIGLNIIFISYNLDWKTTTYLSSLQEGKLIHHGLLLHEPLKLRQPHVELLMRLIRHGAWRHSEHVRDVNAFERSLDQDSMKWFHSIQLFGGCPGYFLFEGVI